MNFPVWELEMGGGLLIAVVSILHVYVSHFAIGGGLFLVLTEHFAYRKNDENLRAYLVTHSRFFALVTLVFGAITGVGIWFTIALVSPAATSALIRIFVFGWAIEWVFFLVEIAAAILYYRTWDTVSRRTHLIIGWFYFAGAFLSLIVINGILTFMLTPGAWLETRGFWDGFFNPTYWPSAIARTAICIALAGIYALLTAPRVADGETRRRLSRYAGLWALTGIVLTVPSLLWYRAALPESADELLGGLLPTAVAAMDVLPWAALGLTVLVLIPILVPRRHGLFIGLLAGVFALVSLGALEWVREAVRKPYVIYDYMYATGLRVGEAEELAAADGLLAATVWAAGDGTSADPATGEEVFRFACRSCHTLGGYRGVREPLKGLEEGYIDGLLRGIEAMRGRMPAFPGNETERKALAAFLAVDAGPPARSATPAAAFTRRCGFCHSVNGDFYPLAESIEGSTREDLIDLIGMIGDLSEQMPEWTAGEEEAGLVADYMLERTEGGAEAAGEEE